ncbi:MAG: lytic transglycosylase domain-containing protein [Polaromonas sp.]
MTALVNPFPDGSVRVYFKNVQSSLATIADDIAKGFFEITHNSFALLGFVMVFAVAALIARPDLRSAGEFHLMTWLQERQEETMGNVEEPEVAELTAVARATASNPKDLPQQQAAVAYWLSKKYSVAPEPLSALVAQAFEIGQKAKLDPTLILAIMAIESGFNPFAQSPVGAQGLMQVMTQIHHDKYENFGGKLAAFDPVTNLRVGVKVLQECISRAGSIEGGLKYYVGAANLPDDGGYTGKVMAEHARLLAVVGGKRPPTARIFSSPAPARPIPVSMPAKPAPAAEPADKTAGQVAFLDQS